MASTLRTPKVWVPQEPRFRLPDGSWKTVNMLPLLDYGAVEVLLEAGEQVTFSAASTVRRIAAKMIDYQAQDFVVAAGDPVAIMIVGAYAAACTKGVFTILKYDRQEKKYFKVPVNLRDLT